MSERNRNDSPYERCVLCGKTTKVKRNTPVRYRTNYIYGVGEICAECAENLKEYDYDRNMLRNID